MSNLILTSIQLIHLLFVMFIVIVPFTNDKKLLTLHALVIPVLYLHWITNDNSCALTLMERNLRHVTGKSIDDCFTCKIIDPIFKFSENNRDINIYIYLFTFGLWCISVFKIKIMT